MKKSIDQKVMLWQSLFVIGFEASKKNLSLEHQVIILLNRVISLERTNVKLKFAIKNGMDPNRVKKKEIKLEDSFFDDLNHKKFYSSQKWLSLRYNFLMNSDRVCVLCGSTNDLHVDHIIPRSIDQSLSLIESNLQILCKSCNFGKSNKDFKKVVLRKRNKDDASPNSL